MNPLFETLCFNCNIFRNHPRNPRLCSPNPLFKTPRTGLFRAPFSDLDWWFEYTTKLTPDHKCALTKKNTNEVRSLFGFPLVPTVNFFYCSQIYKFNLLNIKLLEKSRETTLSLQQINIFSSSNSVLNNYTMSSSRKGSYRHWRVPMSPVIR